MQAGFNAYAQTIRHHALLLAGFQKEIKELKQANTQQDAAVEELQQVNTEKGVRIDELEKRINELQEGNGQQLLQKHLDIEGTSIQSAKGMTLEEQNISLRRTVEAKEDELTELEQEIARLKTGKTEEKERVDASLPSEDVARKARDDEDAAEKARAARDKMTQRQKDAIDVALFDSVMIGGAKDTQELLAKGADVNTRGCFYQTPLIPAAAHGDIEIVNILLAWGATIGARDKDQYTGLIWASFYGHMSVVETLIAKGADINERAWNGDTPLIVCVDNSPTAVEAFLRLGPDVNAVSRRNGTALDCAQRAGNSELVGLLKAAGAKTSAKLRRSSKRR